MNTYIEIGVLIISELQGPDCYGPQTFYRTFVHNRLSLGLCGLLATTLSAFTSVLPLNLFITLFADTSHI